MDRRSWDEIFARVESDDTGKWDTSCNFGDISAVPEGLVIQGANQNSPLWLTHHAESQLCSRLQIPVGYYRRVRETKARLATDLLSHGLGMATADDIGKKTKPTELFVRGKRGSVRAVLSDKYSVVDNKDVVEVVRSLSLSQFKHRIRSMVVTQDSFYIKVTCEDLVVDDPSFPDTRQRASSLTDERPTLKVGFMIGNSEVGSRALSCYPFVYRASCTNDLVVMDDKAITQRHVHLSQLEMKLLLQRSIASALRGGSKMLGTIVQSYEFAVEKPSDVIRMLAKEAQFSQKRTDAILGSFAAEPMNNKFGVIQAFTRAAQSEKDDERIELEMFAGRILQNDTVWKRAA